MVLNVKDVLKEVLLDGKKVQNILSKKKITQREYMNSIPVILSQMFKDKKELKNIFKLLEEETFQFYDILHKYKD